MYSRTFRGEQEIDSQSLTVNLFERETRTSRSVLRAMSESQRLFVLFVCLFLFVYLIIDSSAHSFRQKLMVYLDSL